MSKYFGIMQHLNIAVCQNADEAVKRGFQYSKTHRLVEIEQAVVVIDGTENGNSTVDLIIVNDDGEKMVVMVTGALIKTLAEVCK